MECERGRRNEEEGSVAKLQTRGVAVLTEVGEDDAVALLEPIENLDRVHRPSPELHASPCRGTAVGVEAEDLDRGVRLSVSGTSDEERVRQPLDLDGAVDGQIGTRSGWERAVEGDVDAHRAVARGGVDARDAPRDDAIARVDRRALPDRDVLRLRLRNAEHRLEAARLDDFRQRRAGHRPLTDLEWKLLEHAVGAGGDAHGGDLLATEGEDLAQAPDLRALHVELRGDRIGVHAQPLLLDRIARLELLLLVLRPLQVRGGDQLLGSEPIADFDG